MLRNAARGALVFGIVSAVAGFLWTAFEFPFAILLPAFLGWYAVARPDFGPRKALLAGVVGGLTFTALFILGLFLAISDGAPVAITGWLAAVLAALVAGSLTGTVLGGSRASLPVAAFSAMGMLLATVVAGFMRDLAPDSTQVPGLAQSAYFAAAQGLIGVFVGASVGAGVSWVRRHVGTLLPEDAGFTRHRPHPA